MRRGLPHDQYGTRVRAVIMQSITTLILSSLIVIMQSITILIVIMQVVTGITLCGIA